MTCKPSKDSNQPGHPSLDFCFKIRNFDVTSKSENSMSHQNPKIQCHIKIRKFNVTSKSENSMSHQNPKFECHINFQLIQNFVYINFSVPFEDCYLCRKYYFLENNYHNHHHHHHQHLGFKVSGATELYRS